MCGKLLVAVLPALVEGLPAAVREASMSMSAATMDRQLRSWRKRLGRQPRRAASPASGVKGQIPIRTWSEWKDVQPGSVQGDLVLHCGESAEGFFLTTLTVVDVASGWIELWPAWGTGMTRVRQAVQRSALALPFPLRELTTHNGSEFINHSLRGWCTRQGVSFTRGRGYRKNAAELQRKIEATLRHLWHCTERKERRKVG